MSSLEKKLDDLLASLEKPDGETQDAEKAKSNEKNEEKGEKKGDRS